MWHVCLALSVFFAGAARAAGPAYSADSIVNGANFAAGPLAPNSIASLFGTDLAWWEESLTSENTAAGSLPTTLADVRLYVANYVAPLFYVGPRQINFLIPGNLRTGPVTVRVARQGVTGPEVTITLVDAVPNFFRAGDGYVVAQHTDYSLITPAHPARAGEVIVVYATGLGMTHPNPAPGEIPRYPGLMAHLDTLRVTVGGVIIPAGQILYAGLTPGWAGLYQINLQLPDKMPPNPELAASVGEQEGAHGLRLATSSP
ncbi:MAG TPA: hypothetical protein VKT49_16930 [Bryobacteraceae bacterium]|nr:hypothetical protein [Bryobacteraceae bacterium]